MNFCARLLQKTLNYPKCMNEDAATQLPNRRSNPFVLKIKFVHVVGNFNLNPFEKRIRNFVVK
jgi:hypothetical protein